MVAHPGATVGTHGLRPLGLPKSVTVEVDDIGLPCAVLRGSRLVAVASLEEVWRVVEAWWRDESLARTYVRALLADDRLLTLFHDDTAPPGDGWYEQRY